MRQNDKSMHPRSSTGKSQQGQGLGSSYWPEVMAVLRDIIPVYDKVNRIISLGRDSQHRSRGIRGRVRPGDRILDAGSGFGNMSRTAADIAGADKISITLYDPLVPMLKNTSVLFDAHPDSACGVFEHMPFVDAMFDAVLCGYSLRDAIRLEDAISEMYRVLRPGGRLVIVDLGKPDCMVVRAGVSFYLRCVLPMLALCAGGRLGLKFGTLYGTFQRWPQNRRLRDMLLGRFESVEIEEDLMGGAIMVAAFKGRNDKNSHAQNRGNAK